MRIAIGLPSRVASASGAAMLEWITRAERGPFSSVVVTDRVVSQALEPLAVLALAAGATQRIRLMTSVVIGPTRETTLLARQAATIDLLSGGRLTLGLGIGVRENDYLATGFDFHRRVCARDRAAHRKVGRWLHGAGRRRAGQPAQDVAPNRTRMARGGAKGKAALGRSELLCARSQRRRSREPLYQRELRIQSRSCGAAPPYAAGFARGGGRGDQASERYGR